MAETVRVYIKPIGSGCYDRSGITYPIQHPMDWEAFVSGIGGENPAWEQHYDLPNLQEVITFDVGTEGLDNFLTRWYLPSVFEILPEGSRYSFIVAYHWKELNDEA